MRSNDKSSPFSLIKPRLPLTLAAVVALLSAATAAEAGWFGAKGAGGLGGFFSNRGGDRSVRMVNPVGKLGNGGGGNRITDGGNRHGGDGRPPPIRLPKPTIKPPILVAVPPTITTITPSLSGADPQTKKATVGGNGGGSNNNSSTGQQSPRRAASGVPAAGERRYVPDEVLIQLSSSVTAEAIDAFARSMRLTRVESFTADGITMFRWKIPDPSRRPVPTVIRSLEAQRIVVAAQPNYFYKVQDYQSGQPQTSARPEPDAAPAGEGDAAQYALAKLRLPQAHALAKGEKVLIAVIDSAVDVDHPELEGVIADSYDALEAGDRTATHGTAVVGAIVAHARLMGSAPKASILAIRAFGLKDKVTEGTTYSINKGIVWAMSHGARVINMSFTTGARDPSIEQKLAQAHQRGIVLIAAAGNAGPKSEPLYPAAYPNVIAVTATDADDKLFAGANRGKHIAVAAPGVDLLLPAPGKAYQVKTGTSFAAAEVTGVVALLLERKPDLGQEGVRKALMATARDLGPKGFDPEFGAGLVDAYAAVRSLDDAVATTGTRLTPAAEK
jgi:subtilase family protein/fervidolysin-like protein